MKESLRITIVMVNNEKNSCASFHLAYVFASPLMCASESLILPSGYQCLCCIGSICNRISMRCPEFRGKKDLICDRFPEM